MNKGYERKGVVLAAPFAVVLFRTLVHISIREKIETRRYLCADAG